MVYAWEIVWPTMPLPFFKAQDVGVRIMRHQPQRLIVLKFVLAKGMNLAEIP